jgi:hypothetical protein
MVEPGHRTATGMERSSAVTKNSNMMRITFCLLTLLFSLNCPAMEGNVSFRQSSLAAKEVKLLGTARDNLLNAAQNPKLRDAINNLYRPGAKVGSGSSMDAYRFEQATGQLLSPTGHGQKLFDRRTQLQKLLHDPNLSPSDRQITKDLLIDIQNALGGQ